MEQTVLVGNPWNERKALGLFRAFVLAVKMLIMRPQEFFATLQVEKSFLGPVVFVSLFSFFLAFGSAALVTAFPQAYVLGFETQQDRLIQVLSSPVWNVAMYFPLALICHWGAMILKGNGQFMGTFNVLSFSVVTGIIALLPGFTMTGQVVIGVSGMIWSAVLTVIGYRKIHSLSLGNATAAYALGVLFSMIVFIVISGLLSMVFTFMGLAPNPTCPIAR